MQKKANNKENLLLKESKPSTKKGPVLQQELSIQKNEGPYDIFKNSLKRAENLVDINLASDGKTKFAIANVNLKDAYRAVIVLSISALDAYIRTFVFREIKELLLNRNLNAGLKKYIKEELLDKETLFNIAFEPDFFDKIQKEFIKDFNKQSFQGQRNISSYMALAGYENIFREISKNANISPDNLQRDLEHFTSRRHQIVHRGDYDIDQTEATENKIDESEARNCIKLVETIAIHIHELSKKTI